MIFRSYYLACLSHASYLVGDETTGRAVVVDPQRDVEVYLDDARALGLRIERVIETHFHADFVSGHLELAARTGAVISYGEPAVAEFEIDLVHDGQRLDLGEVVLEVRATPGHTPESISVVVWERSADTEPYGVLTGDTLFVGDVGRPDLVGASEGASVEDMARALHRSLRVQLMTLPDATFVFPAHGAGSACGRALSAELRSTIGEQRRTNHALAPISEDEFVELVTADLPPAPAYFSYSAKRNHEGHELLLGEAPRPLTVDEALLAAAGGAVVLDSRPASDFASGHLSGAVNVGLDGRFAEYAGDVISPGRPIVLVCDAGTEAEARIRLGRIGFDDVVGYLQHPALALQSRPELVSVSSRLLAGELAARLSERALVLIDVRGASEVADGMIPGATWIPLPRLVARASELDPGAATVVYCAGGYRSSIAASTLVALGFDDVSDLIGGYAAWERLG